MSVLRISFESHLEDFVQSKSHYLKADNVLSWLSGWFIQLGQTSYMVYTLVLGYL